MRGLLAVAWLLAVLWLLAAGCSPEGPFEHEALRSEEGGYVLWYRSPPWERWREEGPRAWLAIARAGATLDDVARGVDPKYVLEASPLAQRPEQAARREAAAARGRGEELDVPPRPLALGPEGPAGWELLSRSPIEPVRHHRYVFLERPVRGGSLRLRFSAYPALDEPEVDAMIRLVEPDVAVADAGAER